MNDGNTKNDQSRHDSRLDSQSDAQIMPWPRLNQILDEQEERNREAYDPRAANSIKTAPRLIAFSPANSQSPSLVAYLLPVTEFWGRPISIDSTPTLPRNPYKAV